MCLPNQKRSSLLAGTLSVTCVPSFEYSAQDILDAEQMSKQMRTTESNVAGWKQVLYKVSLTVLSFLPEICQGNESKWVDS